MQGLECQDWNAWIQNAGITWIDVLVHPIEYTDGDRQIRKTSVRMGIRVVGFKLQIWYITDDVKR